MGEENTTTSRRHGVELPLTQPCPQCGAEMEPRRAVRRGRVIYDCPDCGHQMEIAETPDGVADELLDDNLAANEEDKEDGEDEP